MKQYIEITADTNDADYVNNRCEITNEELELIKPVIQAIKDFKPYVSKTEDGKMDWKHDHNYPNGEFVREDLGEKTAEELYGHLEGFEIFNDFCPYGEYGIHTIESIVILKAEETKLL